MTASIADRVTGAIAPAADAASSRICAPYINPETGLSTDYLNHFTEAIMAMEMVAAMPEFAGDLRAWRPKTYCQHFAASGFRNRDAVIAAYTAADPRAVDAFERTVETLNVALAQARDLVMAHLGTPAAEALARRAIARVKPLVARAAMAINGRASADRQDAQSEIDAMFAP